MGLILGITNSTVTDPIGKATSFINKLWFYGHYVPAIITWVCGWASALFLAPKLERGIYDTPTQESDLERHLKQFMTTPGRKRRLYKWRKSRSPTNEEKEGPVNSNFNLGDWFAEAFGTFWQSNQKNKTWHKPQSNRSIPRSSWKHKKRRQKKCPPPRYQELQTNGLSKSEIYGLSHSLSNIAGRNKHGLNNKSMLSN